MINPSREEATAMVVPHVQSFGIHRYRGVTVEDAVSIIGREGVNRLRADKVRCLGPTEDSFYYWNVIDAIVLGYGRDEAENEVNE